MYIYLFVICLYFCAGHALSASIQLPQLNFGVISTESNANLRERWEPLLSDMAKAIDMPVKGFYVTDYSGVIEGMRFNKVQVAWLGNKSAIEGDRPGKRRGLRADGAHGWNLRILFPSNCQKRSSLDQNT
jgi:phosphonate transport system substrate-binding protein